MKIRRFVVAAVLALSISMGAACFGSFSATRGLYGFNKSISGNKFVQTLVMWGLIIVPAYELFGLGDFIIFNVIEFWTGSNVLADGSESGTTRLANVDVIRGEDGSVTIKSDVSTYVLTPIGEDRFTVTVDGVALGTGVAAGDSVVLYDNEGQVLQTLSDLDRIELERQLSANPA